MRHISYMPAFDGNTTMHMCTFRDAGDTPDIGRKQGWESRSTID